MIEMILFRIAAIVMTLILVATAIFVYVSFKDNEVLIRRMASMIIILAAISTVISIIGIMCSIFGW